MSLQVKPSELSLSGPNLLALLRSVHAREVPFRFKAKGSSMHPFIMDGDVVTVVPLRATRVCSGDVAAFTHPGTGRLVIHRVVGNEGDLFLMKGDNAPEIDAMISKAQVLGLVARVEREGRELRLGLGWERILIAFLSRTGLLPILLTPVRRIYRLIVPRNPSA